MNVIVPDYLFTVDVPEIDNGQLYKDCLDIEQHLRDTLVNPRPADGYGCFSSSNHKSYNIFNYDKPGLNQLFRALKDHVLPVMPKDEYKIQCWFNVFRKGDFIDWHGHWPPMCRAWHGFYCVNVGSSYTHYRINHNVYDIQGHDGLLVFGKSDGDEHRSGDWHNDDSHRVTIAFDIIPAEFCKDDYGVFIPL